MGGEVTSEALTVVIPPGSFGAETTVTISESDSQPFEEEVVQAYSIGGIPADYSEPITVRIPYEGDTPEYPAIAIGEEAFPRSGDALVTTWRFIDAVATSGVLEAVIQPIHAEAVGKLAVVADDPAWIALSVSKPKQYTPLVTSGGHFRISYPQFAVTTAQVQQLGDALENAWSIIQGMGFSYAERTAWPVEITVKSLDPPETDGLTTCSMWGDNYAYIEFNTSIMSDPARMRVTAIHEFFHLVQSFYDPRNAYSKAKFRSPTLWLDEATATWIEEKAAPDPAAYQPGTLFTGNFLEPLAGAAHRETAQLEQRYGYGMSAMIDYLAGRDGEDCVLEMYKQVAKGFDAVASVTTATEPYIEWWEEFLRAYVSGGVYGRSFQAFIGQKTGMFSVESDLDSLATYAAGYADLSAKVYVVKFTDPELSDAASLTCGVTGGMSEVTAFSYDNKGNISFVATSTDEVTVPGVRAIGESKGGVLVLVSNCRAISPYGTSSEVTLNLKVNRPSTKDYTHFMFSPQFYGLFSDSRGKSYSDIISGPPFSSSGDGSMAGNTFTASWDTTQNNIHLAGSLLIIFNDDRSSIMSFSGEFLRESFVSQEKLIGSITGGQMPLSDSYYDSTAEYELRGEAVFNCVTAMSYRGETTFDDFWRESTAIDEGHVSFASLFFLME